MNTKSNRIAVEIDCEFYVGKEKFSGTTINCSLTGCRLRVKESIYNFVTNGSTLDVVLHITKEIKVHFIAFVINLSKNEIGLYIAAIDDIDWKLYCLFLNREELNHKNLRLHPILSAKNLKVLFLGPGGGKILAQLRMCKHLEEILQVKLVDFFDHFVGVSSGGVLCALILKYRSLDVIEELIKSFQIAPEWNWFSLQSLFSKEKLFHKLETEFANPIFFDSDHRLQLQYRNYRNSILHTYTTDSPTNSDFKEILKRSISIPAFFGHTDNYVDGAVGGYLNPAELYFRKMRLVYGISKYDFSLYLDAGFDPILQKTSIFENVLSQLFWVLKLSQRDSLLLSVDRVKYEFPNTNFHSYFFTYSKEYNLLNSEDILKSTGEIDAKKFQFQSFISDIISKRLYSKNI